MSVAIKHRLRSPAGLAGASLGTNGMGHSREGRGRAVLAQVAFTRGSWGYNVTLSTGTDHGSFKGLFPESSSARGNFLCVWCRLGFSGNLRLLNIQADPFLPSKCPWTQSTRGRAMTQLQNSWSSTAGKAQCGPAETVPLLVSIFMQLLWLKADSSLPVCSEITPLAAAQEHPVCYVKIHTGNLS